MEHVQQMDNNRIPKAVLNYRPRQRRNLEYSRRYTDHWSWKRQFCLLHEVQKKKKKISY